jgi:hypothetical protein
MGFLSYTPLEAEAGFNLKLWYLNLSAGPHWRRIGRKDSFLDYNLGIGIDLPYLIKNSDVIGHGYEDEEFVYGKYIYTKGAPIGLEIGLVEEENIGAYLKYQMYIPSVQKLRVNLSAGGIIAISGLTHMSFGAGVGYYDGGSIGFDLEAAVILNVIDIPISFGIKSCRFGSKHNFISHEYGIGFYND